MKDISDKVNIEVRTALTRKLTGNFVEEVFWEIRPSYILDSIREKIKRELE